MMILGGRASFVIASEAKQSRTAMKTGLLRRFAPRNDDRVNRSEIIKL